MKVLRFQDLNIWKLSLKVTKQIYILTSNEKFSKDFSFRDQIRRATLSISSNIVEGFEKNNNNEFIRYLKIVKGSIGEVKNQLIVALEIGHLNRSEYDSVFSNVDILARQSASFISYLLKTKRTFKPKNL